MTTPQDNMLSAIEAESIERLKQSVTDGADIYHHYIREGGFSENAFGKSVSLGFLAGVSYLASLDEQKRFDYQNTLAIAASYGHLDVVSYLMKNHVRSDEVSEALNGNCYENAFAYAVMNERTDVVSHLIDNGVNVDAEDGYALISCARDGNIEMVALIIAADADIHAQDDAAFIAASQEGRIEVIDLFLNENSAYYKKLSKTNTALLECDQLQAYLLSKSLSQTDKRCAKASI